jgi:hypothetical protein
MFEYVHIEIKGNSFERFGYFVNPNIRVCNRLDVFWERAQETTTLLGDGNRRDQPG